MRIVSIVFPVWNEAENLTALSTEVRDACRQAQVDYEMVFVDNGSTDESLEVIKRLRAEDPKIRYLSLSRNFGHQNALFAGMSVCRGDAIITMDADLQHPPALLPQLIALWQDGAEVVYTTKRNARVPWPRLLMVKLFYWGISKLSGLELDFGLSDFRLLDRKVAEVILQIPEYHKFLRGQVKWVGFRQRGVLYDVEDRLRSVSKFSYRHLVAFALDGLFAFSRYPLRIVGLIGALTAGLALLYMLFVFSLGVMDLLRIAHHLPWPPGWATLTVAILFLGSLQLVAIGVLGEYIGRVYDQTKGRPVFIVRERSDDHNPSAPTRHFVRGTGQPLAAASH
ncbi:MAG: glycosyltransferase family 2 protein [Candidatus Omnitrophica bacterium]|nr:glycosyltransferase family 2 protein [Candidatus Omnitrophota bacterium]